MSKFKNLKLFVLDNDDVLFKSSPLIQFHVEKNWPNFSSSRLTTRERQISIDLEYRKFVANEINRVKKVAEETGILEIPNLPDLNIIRNDVIKIEGTKDSDFEYEYYIRPLEEIDKCLELARYDKEMFLENRDALVEADGKLEKGVIPYDEIYNENNWIEYTRNNVSELYNIFGDRLISLTAHNGIDDMHGREFDAKGEAVHKIEKNINHYGLRFHNSEHIPGIRRPRNSKGLKIKEIYGLDTLEGVVIADDSMDNCLDIYKHGGTPIFVNPSNKTNQYGFAMVRSIKPESIFRELTKCGFSDDSDSISQKPKILKK